MSAKRGCAAVILAILLLAGGLLAWRWWRAPGHGGLIMLSGSLTAPYELEGHVSLRVSRDHPDCIAFKVQNPMPAYDSVRGKFQRLGGDRYRMVWDLREAPLGGFCDWRIEELAVHLAPWKSVRLSASPLLLTPASARPSGDERPWWKEGPMSVHCTDSGNKRSCPDAVNAIHDVEPEGQYTLDIEVIAAPAP